MRNTSSIGQIGEVAVMKKLIAKGWQVLIPYGNAAPYDLVVEKEGQMRRLQVRATRAKGNFISVNCRTKNNRIRLQPGRFDFLVVYELDSDIAFVIAASDIWGKAVFHIRLSPSRSGQFRGTHPAEDHREHWDKLDMV
jgi:hypothetical protein